jgi:DNA repair exonuclease SbcCD nuclease subunit
MFNENGQRLNNTLSVLNDMFEVADKNKISTILFVGDLFDQQKSLLVEVINRTTERFSTLFSAYPDIKFVCISGNHDYNSKNTLEHNAESSIMFLSEVFDNFIVIDNKEYVIDNKYLIYGIPYYQHKEHFLARLKSAAPDCDLLLIHQNAPNQNPMITQDFTLEDIESFNMVLCGHIHKHEKVSKNLTIVGSPLHKDLNDEGQDKGYLIYNLETNSYKRHLLEAYPKFSAGEKLLKYKATEKSEVKIIFDRSKLFLDFCKSSKLEKGVISEGLKMLQ